jgi:hypothetical protein
VILTAQLKGVKYALEKGMAFVYRISSELNDDKLTRLDSLRSFVLACYARDDIIYIGIQ